LENLVKALYGEGWDELTINDAEEWNEGLAKKNTELATLKKEETMIEKTSLNVTGETFLCPYCQTWLELPPALKAKLLAKKNEEIAALLRGRKSIIQFMKTEFEKELAKKNKEIARLKRRKVCQHRSAF